MKQELLGVVLTPEWTACGLPILLWLGSGQESIGQGGSVKEQWGELRGKMQQEVVLTCFVCLWLSMGGVLQLWD